MNSREDNGQWIGILDNYIETGQRQDFNDYKLVQDKYLRGLTVTDNLGRRYLPDRSDIKNDRQTGHYSQTQRSVKIDRMSI